MFDQRSRTTSFILTLLPLLAFAQTKIYIDPGHGGADVGVTNATFGTQEAERALFTALELQDYLLSDTQDQAGGGAWEVRMSRDSNISLTLAGRTQDANSFGPSAFISIHQSALNNAVNGTETFSVSNLDQGGRLRDIVQQEAVDAWGLFNRGGSVGELDYLQNINAPAVLTSMGYIDAPVDHDFIISDEECTRYALALMFALQRFQNLPEYEPGPIITDEVIVDNEDLMGYEETGPEVNSWRNSGFGIPIGTNGRFAGAGDIGTTAIWTPNLLESGEYEVAVYYVSGTNRSSAALYKVNHAEGSASITVNQTSNGQQWNTIGVFNFFAGTQGNVILDAEQSSDDGSPTTVVIADAVRFRKIGDFDIQLSNFWLFE